MEEHRYIMGKKSKSKSKSKSSKEQVVEVVEEQSTDIQEASSEQVEVVETSKKTKKVVCFSDDFESLFQLRETENSLRDQKQKLIKEHDAKMKELNTLLKRNRKEQNTLFNKLPNVHAAEVKIASKEKRKRTGKNTGGFNKEQEVPKVLVKYLGLDADKKLPRPQVMHLLNEKFKSENLKNGQITVLDKKNAKKLGKPEGYEITFSQGQTFLASFYNKESSVDV